MLFAFLLIRVNYVKAFNFCVTVLISMIKTGLGLGIHSLKVLMGFLHLFSLSELF